MNKLSIYTTNLLSSGGMALTLFACGIGGGIEAPDVSEGGPLSNSLILQYKDCQEDEDCIYVQNGCCDCANGGEDDAINEDQQTAFLENFDCTTVTCTMLATDPPCGSGTITCESGKCEYTSLVQDFPSRDFPSSES